MSWAKGDEAERLADHAKLLSLIDKEMMADISAMMDARKFTEGRAIVTTTAFLGFVISSVHGDDKKRAALLELTKKLLTKLVLKEKEWPNG